MSLGAHKEVDQSDVIIFTIFASKGAQGYTDLDLSVSQNLHLVWPSKCYLQGRSEVNFRSHALKGLLTL